jgi:hypothetical protein
MHMRSRRKDSLGFRQTPPTGAGIGKSAGLLQLEHENGGMLLNWVDGTI